MRTHVEVDGNHGRTPAEGEPKGQAAYFICPECKARMIEVRNGELFEHRSQIGHSYPIKFLSETQADALERAVWLTIRRLQEQRISNEALLKSGYIDPAVSKRLQDSLAALNSDLDVLQEILGHYL